MSDEQNEQVKQGSESPQPTKTIDLTNLVAGYVVGVNKEGDLFFESIGKANLLNLSGLNHFATTKVNQLWGQKLMTGDRLTHEVGKAVALVNAKLDQLAEQKQSDIEL